MPTLVAGPVGEATSAAQWNQRPSSVIEFQVRTPYGTRELVAMPWRLMASGRLEQRMGAAGFADIATSVAAPTLDLHPLAQALALQPAQAAGRADAGNPRGVVSGSHVPMPPIAMSPAPDGDSIAPLPSLPSASPAAVEWLARWMKWIERDGHDPMVLLRDFRIDDDQARRVVDGLRAFAREYGIGLDRILVNGREFWRRPDLSHTQE